MINWKKTVLVVGLLSLALIGMVAKKQWTLITGTPIVLKTVPIDPRSLFSGDYVRLSYSVSELDLDRLGGDNRFEKHDVVYVVLKPAGQYWQAVSLHHRQPVIHPNEVVMRGEAEYTNSSRWDRETDRNQVGAWLRVHYGIENYYVPEGEGRELERTGPSREIAVRVAVDRLGHAGILAVLVNGVEQYVETLF